MSTSSEKEPSVYDRLSEWYVEAGLYQTFRMTFDEVKELAMDIHHRNGVRIDCYCTVCRDASVFTYHLHYDIASELQRTMRLENVGQTGNIFEFVIWMIRQMLDMTLTCARNKEHTLRLISTFEWVKEDNTNVIKLMKIGQLPSKFDLLRADLAKYSKVADDTDLRELRSAAMCDSHGFHVAAFVYLRRVFERRLEIAHQQARGDSSWDESNYDPRTMRMEERIEVLAKHLPEFLVENRVLYKILSKGIHELTEAECEDAYTAVEEAIGLILDEELERREKTHRATRAKAALGRLSGKSGKK